MSLLKGFLDWAGRTEISMNSLVSFFMRSNMYLEKIELQAREEEEGSWLEFKDSLNVVLPPLIPPAEEHAPIVFEIERDLKK